jgi:hypothetical protein
MQQQRQHHAITQRLESAAPTFHITRALPPPCEHQANKADEHEREHEQQGNDAAPAAASSVHAIIKISPNMDIAGGSVHCTRVVPVGHPKTYVESSRKCARSRLLLVCH